VCSQRRFGRGSHRVLPYGILDSEYGLVRQRMHMDPRELSGVCDGLTPRAYELEQCPHLIQHCRDSWSRIGHQRDVTVVHGIVQICYLLFIHSQTIGERNHEIAQLEQQLVLGKRGHLEVNPGGARSFHHLLSHIHQQILALVCTSTQF